MQIGPQNRAGAGYNDTYLRDSLGEANPDDPAAPESRLRGLIDWRYEESDPTMAWTLKPGRSVMFTRSRELMLPSDVQEGDVFSIYVNPLSPVSRIALTYFGGIDERPERRYVPGTAMSLRYTFIPEYTDATGEVIQEHFGLRTIQQTQPGTVIYRGEFSTKAYYIVGDEVTYEGASYLRIVEGGDGTGFNPANWIGGGSGTPGTGTARDPYAVDAAKRKAVVDAGLNLVLETDPAYYGKKFGDDVYGPDQPAFYQCIPFAPAQDGGATIWKWARTEIL